MSAAPLELEDLVRHPSVVLKDNGCATARLVRYDLPTGSVVHKSWPRSDRRVVRWWAGMTLRREARHYEALRGTPGIPMLRADFGDRGFVVDYKDAETLVRAMPEPRMRRALDDLERVIDQLHLRGFVHLDLHQRRNILVDAADSVWLVDLVQGLDCRHGLIQRLFFPLLKRIDRNAVKKFRVRYVPDTIREEDRKAYMTRYGQPRTRWWHDLARRVRRALAR